MAPVFLQDKFHKILGLTLLAGFELRSLGD